MTSLLDISATLSLTEDLDKELMVVLRDGGNFKGTLRSFDQFGNLVLDSTIRRYIVGNKYHDKTVGVYLVRGDAIQMLGQVDSTIEHSIASGTSSLQKVSWAEMSNLINEESERKERVNSVRLKLMEERGVPTDDAHAHLDDL